MDCSGPTKAVQIIIYQRVLIFQIILYHKALFGTSGVLILTPTVLPKVAIALAISFTTKSLITNECCQAAG